MRAFVVVILLFAILAVPSATVRADIAPPAQPPGSNPQPGAETTQVRMVSETVTLDILSTAPASSLGRAKVTASFTMNNQGNAAETMGVRFPIGVEDPRSGNPQITDMAVKVDGKPASIRKVNGEDPYYGSGSAQWIEFDTTFAPGKDVNIQVSYTLEAGGESPFALFNYLFSTGAGWNGTIGNATLIVRFPYEVNEMNVLPSYKVDEPNLVADHRISATELKWTWSEFDPENGDNFNLQVVTPSLWQKAIDMETQLLKTPRDGEAWGMLGKLYKSFAFNSRGKGFRFGNYTSDSGVQELFHKSVAAYNKAVTLKPLDAQWHAGYADLLVYYAYFAGFEGVGTTAQMIQGLNEIDTALHLAPKDPKVLEIADQIMWYAGEGMVKAETGYAFPWLTATPAPTATQIGIDVGTITDVAPTPATIATIQATATSNSTKVPTTPPAKKPVALCGSVIFLPLLLGMMVISRRK